MAEKIPRTSEQMLNISGIGQKKLEKYGQQFLDFFLYLNSIEAIPVTNTPVQKPIQDQSKKSAPGGTYIETLSLYKSGLTVEQIAIQRNLTINTIYSHIEALYSADKIDNLEPFISTDEIQSLSLVLPKSTIPPLKVIFESLGGTLEYYKIKLILAHLKKTQREDA